MSLTSRVLDLFSTAGASNSTTITQSANTTDFYKDVNLSDVPRQTRAEDLLDDEEPRPPYVHVRLRYRSSQLGIKMLT